jgi:hypothetical protein
MAQKIEMIVNYSKAVEVAQKATLMLRTKTPPFNRANLFPDAIIPAGIKQGGQDHSLIIFYGCSLDALWPADKIYEAVRNISQETDLRKLHRMNEDGIAYLLEKNLGKLPEKQVNNPIKTLQDNSELLSSKYRGDPRIIQAPTIQETLDNLEEFYGVGVGKAALIMKNFVRFGIWNFSEFEIPIKIDRHNIRISLGNKVIAYPGDKKLKTQYLIKPLQDVYRQVTQREKISAIDLNDAIWGIGSKLCTTNNKKYCKLYCGLNCTTRPTSTTSHCHDYFPEKESRKDNGDILFK